MIVSKDAFDINKLKIKKIRTFSNKFQFYPLQYDNKQIIFQTPLLYVPYKIQTINEKQYITISTINYKNDKMVKKFIQKIQIVETFLQSFFQGKNISPILKNDMIRLKLYRCLFFDEYKRPISDIPSHTYGNFIINIYGIWNHDNTYNVQCHLLQCKISMPFYLTNYGFIEESLKIPPAPPLPSKFTKKKYQRKKSIQVKKKQSNFLAPSLQEIQQVLNNFKLKIK
jgi:hypothetical protein